jgi:predicted AlkP superfamily pyrophosphatase or phosphodiesterase
MKLLSRLIGMALFSVTAACAPMGAQVARTHAPLLVDEVRQPVTILVSIDAFRPDNLYRGFTPNLDALAKGGVQGRMRPSFPTLTFPNHEVLVTGLRPDRSGIVANSMYDPAMPGVKFYNKDPSSLDPFWWKEAEPIWITAEKQRVRTGIMFWPGGEVAQDDLRASDWIRFDPNFSEAQRVRTLLDWMRRPEDIRPRFATLYLDSVDRVQHKQGPKSPAGMEAVRQADTRIGDLVAGLATLHQPANLVIVSDHGMREVDLAQTTDLDALMPRDVYRLASYGPFATIDPQPGHEAQVEAVLLRPLPHAQCWRKADIPARYHYGKNARVAGIVCLAVAGGEILTGTPTNKGEHGYDDRDPDMEALFLVNGPALRSGATAPPLFDNVDLYPFLARLIGITPLPSDGDPAVLDGLIAKP